jgi:hypothetical protein
MIRKIFISCAFLTVLASSSKSQQAEKVWFDNNDSVYGYYDVIKPSTPRIQGVLVLLDGYAGNADGFLSETKIHNVAYVNEILTVCIPTGKRLFADTSMIALMNRILTEVVNNYHVKKTQFAIGGMSSGGTIALRYAELCKENPADYPVLPSAVFDVDAPLDLLGLYQSSARDLQKNYPGWWLSENRMIIKSFNKDLGDPEKDTHKYRSASPFYAKSKEPGNEKYLKDVSYRSYHDVDVNWYIQNRRRSLNETNILNASELVNRLALMGNNQAEFVSSKIEGRRSNGQRNPHSWNIVDEIDLVQWLKDRLHFYPDHLERPFVYNAPPDWTKEFIFFPLDFAPSVNFDGFEELRFAPFWGDSTSYQKWAYTILWWINDSVTFNENSLKDTLEAYYSGLTWRRIIADKQDSSLFKPASVLMQKTATLKGDLETYYATAFIYDAQVTRLPGELYFKIHVKDCGDRTKTIVLLEVAENSFSAPIWKELGKINEDFRCGK